MLALAFALLQNPEPFPIEKLDLKNVIQGWGSPRAGQSVDGHPLSIAGVQAKSGLGTHAVSHMRIRVKDGVGFLADVGVDDEVGKQGSAEFIVLIDGKRAYSSGVMHGGEAAKHVSVNIPRRSANDAHELELIVQDGEDGIDYDHADWANAVILGYAKPTTLPTQIKTEPPMPIAYGDLPGVHINGPRVIGTTPGRPFLFKVPFTVNLRSKGATTGFHVPTFKLLGGTKLPAGLTLDPNGIISGRVQKAGTYRFRLRVVGPYGGEDERAYSIVAGDHKLAMTPPMGWNSWNIWATSVTAQKVKDSADAFIKAGLADYGYQYVNIDDAWEGGRDSDGFIQTNKKFGDMKALADYVHSKGLKLGIYSGPGPRTCAGYEASYQHELKDAQQYARWGIDYLKYDWCSYGEIAPPKPTLEEYQKPYVIMRTALDQVSRDIVYSLCQYGMGDVYKWGRSVAGGNLWRTTGDITDTWASMSNIGFSHTVRSTYVQPGGWNDPDMLVVGKLGWGPTPRETRLTPNEQITHITLWSMLAAPLIIGCDLTKLDKFTKAILCNHDVIEVDQDPLGKAATQRIVDGHTEVWARPLWDGTMAVGLFNRGSEKAVVKCPLGRLGYKGAQQVRDLWLMKNRPGKTMLLQAEVPAHGAMLFKVGTPRR